MKIKVGLGYDVHRLEEGHTLNIGGIEIPHNKGSVGHSDADVLIHSICDSLLGAANLRDIGYNFPDTDNTYKNIDSKILLVKTLELIQKKGFTVGNIDCTICLEEPKLSKHIPNMIEILSKILELDIDDVSIKATTTEKLGSIGKGEGISAYCIALITKI